MVREEEEALEIEICVVVGGDPASIGELPVDKGDDLAGGGAETGCCCCFSTTIFLTPTGEGLTAISLPDMEGALARKWSDVGGEGANAGPVLGTIDTEFAGISTQ